MQTTLEKTKDVPKDARIPAAEPQSNSIFSRAQPHTVLLTGGQGFIGSHLVRYLLRNSNATIINVDCNTYAAAGGSRFGLFLGRGPIYANAKASEYGDECAPVHPERDGPGNPRHIWYETDVCNREALRQIFDKHKPDYVVHLAAETHVDRAIESADPFVQTNVQGTLNLLNETAERWRPFTRPVVGSRRQVFLYVSTDEVYGSLSVRPSKHFRDWDDPIHTGFQEWHPLNPGNPYSATKAAAEHLVRAFGNTEKLPFIITRGANTFGTYQFPEKFLPVVVLNVLTNEPIPLYGNGKQQREWLHVADHVEAIVSLMYVGEFGETYNVGSGVQMANMDLVILVSRILDRKPRITLVKDRPGHDRSYRMDGSKLHEALDWTPRFSDVSSGNLGNLEAVVNWYASEEGREWISFTRHNFRQRRGLR